MHIYIFCFLSKFWGPDAILRSGFGLVLKDLGTGWASQIDKKLEEYKLERSWDKMSQCPKATWKNAVSTATELKNKEELIDMCSGVKGEKTKTRFVLDALKEKNYKRGAHNAILIGKV